MITIADECRLRFTYHWSRTAWAITFVAILSGEPVIISCEEKAGSTAVDLDYLLGLRVSQSRFVPSTDQAGEALQCALYAVHEDGIVGLARVSVTGRMEGGFITVTHLHAFGSIKGFGSASPPMARERLQELQQILKQLPPGSSEKPNRNVFIARIPMGDGWQTTYYDLAVLPTELKPLLILIPGYEEKTNTFRERHKGERRR